MDSLRPGAPYLIGEVGEDWWRDKTTATCSASCSGKARSRSEDVAARLGFNPLDLRPLVSEITARPSQLGVSL